MPKPMSLFTRLTSIDQPHESCGTAELPCLGDSGLLTPLVMEQGTYLPIEHQTYGPQ